MASPALRRKSPGAHYRAHVVVYPARRPHTCKYKSARRRLLCMGRLFLPQTRNRLEEVPPHERGNRGGKRVWRTCVELKCNILGTSTALRRLTRIHTLHRRGALGSATRRGGSTLQARFAPPRWRMPPLYPMLLRTCASTSMAHAPPPARNHSAVVY